MTGTELRMRESRGSVLRRVGCLALALSVTEAVWAAGRGGPLTSEQVSAFLIPKISTAPATEGTTISVPTLRPHSLRLISVRKY